LIKSDEKHSNVFEKATSVTGVGKITALLVKDKILTERLEVIANMLQEEQKQLFNVIDALIRDYKTKKAYNS
jgi:hypothetical protein